MSMRIVDCINCYVLMGERPAYRLIVVLHPLGADRGKPAIKQPLNRVISRQLVL